MKNKQSKKPEEPKPLKASGVLLSYKRQQNIPTIIERMLATSFIDDVVVWDNNPDDPLLLDDDYLGRVRVVHSHRNRYCLARYLATKFTKHPIIATCDDDQLVGNWEELWLEWLAHQEQIVANLDAGHFADDYGKHFGTSHLTLVGFGSIWNARDTFVFDQYIERYGEDSVLERKADRLFTVLQNRKHHVIEHSPEPLWGVGETMALHRLPDHRTLNVICLERGLGLLGIPFNVREPSSAKRRREIPPGGPHRVLIVYDIDGWAYHRRALALQTYSPEDFAVEIVALPNVDWLRASTFDIVFNLDYSAAGRVRESIEHTAKDAGRAFTGSVVTSYNVDRGRHQDRWGAVMNASDFVIANNRDIFDFMFRPAKTCNISNGVDLATWRPTTNIEDRPDKVIWCGSASTKKKKNYEEILVPLKIAAEKEGFECDFRLCDDQSSWLDTEQQKQWYGSGAYVLCVSEAEGTPNYLFEAIACGCVPVTTRVGNVPEYADNRVNSVLIEPTVESAMEGLRYAREHRQRLSLGAQCSIKRWRWSLRSEYFFELFRRLIAKNPPSPFAWIEVESEGI